MTSYQMKNDSKLSIACWGMSMGLAWRYLWLLLSLGSGVTWKVEIRKKIWQIWAKMPDQGMSSDFCTHHIFCSLCYWNVKKQNCVLLVLIQGPQTSRFYSVSKWGVTEGFPCQMLFLTWQKGPFIMICLLLAMFPTLAQELSLPNPVY